ncbi:MAG: queuosine salvage family protein [Brevefilum sp.]|nr:queuosine salvage family protein [Brevefilum sp.]
MTEKSNIYEMSLDPRVSINQVQVNKIAQVIKDLPAASQPDFVGEYLPPINHPLTLDYFFAVTLQQFSFWETKDGKYDKPLLAVLDGKQLKGSSYLFYAYTRMLEVNPAFFTPEGQANLSLEELENVFRDDQRDVQMPAIELHLQQARAYGRDMLESDLTPEKILKKSHGSEKPLGTFLSILGGLGGYKEDPLQKKSNLLALCLSQRPEGFLKFGEDESIGPIVDYHCMRSILRTGMIDILDEDMKTKLTHRQIVSPRDEWAVRFASYQVLKQLVELSGRPISVVDEFLFRYMRSHCPEMTEPKCSECLLDKVCAKRKELFQPVIRTTFY